MGIAARVCRPPFRALAAPKTTTQPARATSCLYPLQIDQTFSNPYDGREEGTFVFNLPRGASVSRFDRNLLPVLREAYLAAGRLLDARRAKTDL